MHRLHSERINQINEDMFYKFKVSIQIQWNAYAVTNVAYKERGCYLTQNAPHETVPVNELDWCDFF